ARVRAAADRRRGRRHRSARDDPYQQPVDSRRDPVPSDEEEGLMAVPFELQIALRYLLAKRKQAFISVISSISTLGVTVGVMAVIIALAIMTGLQQELRDRIVGANPHVYVWSRIGIADYHKEVEKLRRVPHVVGAAPAVLGRALISPQNNREAIQIKGIDPALEPTVTDLKSAMLTGSIDGLVSSNQDR